MIKIIFAVIVVSSISQAKTVTKEQNLRIVQHNIQVLEALVSKIKDEKVKVRNFVKGHNRRYRVLQKTASELQVFMENEALAIKKLQMRKEALSAKAETLRGQSAKQRVYLTSLNKEKSDLEQDYKDWQVQGSQLADIKSKLSHERKNNLSNASKINKRNKELSEQLQKWQTRRGESVAVFSKYQGLLK